MHNQQGETTRPLLLLLMQQAVVENGLQQLTLAIIRQKR